MSGFQNALRHLAHGCARRHTVEISSRGHDVLHLYIVKAQDAQDHGAFGEVQFPFVAGFLTACSIESPERPPNRLQTRSHKLLSVLRSKRISSGKGGGTTAFLPGRGCA